MSELNSFHLAQIAWNFFVSIHQWVWTTVLSLWEWIWSWIPWFSTLPVFLQEVSVVMYIIIGILYARSVERREPSVTWLMVVIRGVFSTLFWLPLLAVSFGVGISAFVITLGYGLGLAIGSILLAFALVGAMVEVPLYWVGIRF